MEQALSECEREERKGTVMGHTIFLVVFSSLVTVGMVLLIMWGMSNVDPRRKGYGKGPGEHSDSSEICPELPLLIDVAYGEAGGCKAGFVGGKPFDDQSLNPSWHRYPERFEVLCARVNDDAAV